MPPVCTICGKQATRQDINGEWWPPCAHAKRYGLHTLQYPPQEIRRVIEEAERDVQDFFREYNRI